MFVYSKYLLIFDVLLMITARVARPSELTHFVMSTYKTLAADFISRKSITNIDDITGVVIYAFLKEIENKQMAKYHSEANRYCYQLIDGTIGTLPKCSVDRITNEVIGLN